MTIKVRGECTWLEMIRFCGGFLGTGMKVDVFYRVGTDAGLYIEQGVVVPGWVWLSVLPYILLKFTVSNHL